MGMTNSKPYRFIVLSEDIEEVKKMRKYNNQIIPDKSTAIAVDTNEQFIFQDGKWEKMTIKMPIDEAIEIINHYLDYPKEEVRKALLLAISTMHKYQKIVSIVSLNDEEFKQCGLKELKEILEVIADGNDD